MENKSFVTKWQVIFEIRQASYFSIWFQTKFQNAPMKIEKNSNEPHDHEIWNKQREQIPKKSTCYSKPKLKKIYAKKNNKHVISNYYVLSSYFINKAYFFKQMSHFQWVQKRKKCIRFKQADNAN